jgi:hypothetical protein
LSWAWLQEDFEDAFGGGSGEGFGGLGQGEAFGDEGGDVDAVAGEEAEGGGEAAAAGTDERQFVDDYGGGVYRDQAVDGRFENQRAAGAGERYRLTETFGGASGIDGVAVGLLREAAAGGEFGGDAGLGGDG